MQLQSSTGILMTTGTPRQLVLKHKGLEQFDAYLGELKMNTSN